MPHDIEYHYKKDWEYDKEPTAWENENEKQVIYYTEKYIKKPLKGALILILSCFIFSVAFLQISRDISLPYNIWLKGFKNESYKIGDYIFLHYKNPNDKIVTEKNLIKQIRCAEGDTLSFKNGEFFCNDLYLCNVIEVTKNNLPLTPMLKENENIIIPHNQYFVMGTHERSYDSRYFGLININMINYKMIPIRHIFK